MATMLYYELPIAVFSAEVRRAIVHAASLDPWTDGDGTAAVLSQPALEAGFSLPPIAMYPLYRAGICLSGYSSRLAPLFKQVGGADLAWWGWPTTGKALLAADWQYQWPLDDPMIREIIYRLFEQPLQIQVAVHAAQPVEVIVSQVLEQLSSARYPWDITLPGLRNERNERNERVKEHF